MGLGETMVAIAGIGLMIAILIFAGMIFRRVMDHKERQLGLTANATAEKAAQYAQHIQVLEQRVRVLERIATDKGADLALQIEELRAPPLPAARLEEEERA